jgi:hypothetical protein
MEARPGAMEDHLGVLESLPRANEAHNGAIKTHPGPMEALPEVTEAHPKDEELPLEL